MKSGVSFSWGRVAREVDRVIDDMVRYRHFPDNALHRKNVTGGQDRLEFMGSFTGGVFDDGPFFIALRIADLHHEHEAVQLGFRQRVGAFLLHRVLRGENEKWRLKRECLPGRGDLRFLHRLEESRLGFGRRAVDFVREQHIRENGTFDEIELAPAGLGVFLNDVGAGDIAGHEVGRELDAVEAERENLGEGGDHEGFGKAGYANQEAVAAGEHGDEERIEYVGLADDDFMNFEQQRFARRFELFDREKFGRRGRRGGRGGRSHAAFLR